jgi:hypothetical protein
MNLTIKIRKDDDDFLEPDIFTNAKFSTNQSAKRKLLKLRQNSITGFKLKRSLVGEINTFEFQKNLILQREKDRES